MHLKDELSSFGWSIKTEFFEGNNKSFDAMKEELLNSDLRHIGEKYLPDIEKLDQTTKPYIVQLHKTRNVTVPKNKETTSRRPHLYRLIITDGHRFQNALILPSLKLFNLDIPPGVKLLMKSGTKISNGFYILNDESCEVLGGTVDERVQQWKLEKLVDKNSPMLIGNEMPPRWIPFGTSQDLSTQVDTSKRAMDVIKMRETHAEDPDFVNLRRGIVLSLLTGRISKRTRIVKKNVTNASNVQKFLELASRELGKKNGKIDFSSLLISSKSRAKGKVKKTNTAKGRLSTQKKRRSTSVGVRNKKRGTQSTGTAIKKRKHDDDDGDDDDSGPKPKRKSSRVKSGTKNKQTCSNENVLNFVDPLDKTYCFCDDVDYYS